LTRDHNREKGKKGSGGEKRKSKNCPRYTEGGLKPRGGGNSSWTKKLRKKEITRKLVLKRKRNFGGKGKERDGNHGEP